VALYAYHRVVDLPQTILAIILGLVAAWLILVAVVWLHRPSRELAGPVLRIVPDLVSLVRSLLADTTTPPSVKLALGGLLVYLVSPIDLVPDFVPVAGSLDDVVIAGLVLRWAGRRVGTEDLRSHWTGSPEGFGLLRRLLGI
jgi:uncharacterized membrane protein YkvA (DUF1232 family)